MHLQPCRKLGPPRPGAARLAIASTLLIVLLPLMAGEPVVQAGGAGGRSFSWIGGAQAAEPQSLASGDAIVIQASDGNYYYAVVDRLYREHGVDMVAFSWQTGDRYGRGYMPRSGRVGKGGQKLFSVADARRRNLGIANDLASTQRQPPASGGSPGGAAAASSAPNPLATPASGPFDAAERNEMLASHNRWRREVGVGPLDWSKRLATSAQDWARHIRSTRNCRIDAGAHSQRPDIGENLAYYSPLRSSSGSVREQSVSATRVANDWGREQRDYNPASNSCSGVCGHYTQMVWAATSQVGCGRAVCADQSQVWVCQYSPPGNYVGQKPY